MKIGDRFGKVVMNNGSEAKEDRVVEDLICREMHLKVSPYRGEQRGQGVGIATKLKEITADGHVLLWQIQCLREEAQQDPLNHVLWGPAPLRADTPRALGERCRHREEGGLR